MTQELFESIDEDLVPQPDPNKDWLTELVGDGKKFQDAKALAYSAAVKDAFIEQLKKENARIRGEITKTKTVDEILTQIEQRTMKQPDAGNQSQPSGAEKTVTPEELAELVLKRVRDEVSTERREDIAKANVGKVRDALEKLWGPEYPARLEAETRKLNLGKDFVTSLARERPDALLVLVGATKGVQETVPVVPKGAVNLSPGPSKSGEKTYSYYQKLKKENRSLYETPAIQNEMHQQAQKLREAFFDA